MNTHQPIIRLCALLAVVSVALGSLTAGPAGTQPASAPGWAELMASASQPAGLRIQPAATVDEALAYTEAEKTILADVLDRNGQYDTPALGVLLHRAAMLPADRDVLLPEADRPSMKKLWAEPERYRGRLVWVEGNYQADGDFSNRVKQTVRWAGRVHQVLLIETESGDGGHLLILMPGEHKIRAGKYQRLAAGGVFYKTARLPGGFTMPGGKVIDVEQEYAFVVAPRLYSSISDDGGWLSRVPASVVIIFVIVVVLLAGFFVLKRRLTQAGRGKPMHSDYKPMRFEDAADGEEIDEVEDGPVDPELVREAQAFKGADADETKGDGSDGEDDPR